MRTDSQVVVGAGGAGLQVEVREGEEQPAALAAAEAPVALSVGVVGQRVAGGGEASRRNRQSPTTAWRTAGRQVSMRNKWTFVISSFGF